MGGCISVSSASTYSPSVCEPSVGYIDDVTYETTGPSGERLFVTDRIYHYEIRQCTGGKVKGTNGYTTYEAAEQNLRVYMKSRPCERCGSSVY